MNDRDMHPDGSGTGEGAAPAAAPQEIELKLFVPAFSVDRFWHAPSIAAHAHGPRKVSRIANRYFDTPQRELAQAHMALRLRRTGRRWAQTLKTSDAAEHALSARGEWEMPVAGPALELPRFAGTPLAGVAPLRSLGRRLQPLFATEFRRETQQLRLDDDVLVELAFDRGAIVVGRGRTRRTAPLCEVELEWIAEGGDRSKAEASLWRFAAKLTREVALIPLAESKAARGYHLCDNGFLAPAKVVVPVPEPAVAARLHLARVLRACNAALLGNAHALFEMERALDARHAIDPQRIDCVHQARVAIRRMRSALRLFRPVAKSARVDALDDELKRIGAVFGEARDEDVFAIDTMPRMNKLLAHEDAGRAATGSIVTQSTLLRLEAHRRVMLELDRGLFGATVIGIERIVRRLADQDTHVGRRKATLVDCAAGWLDRQYDRVIQRARRLASLDRKARHRLRIEVKQLRYALDLLEALYPREASERFGDVLAKLQKRLGQLNDETVALALLEAMPPAPGLDDAMASYSRWLDEQVEEQLPKIGARAVALELTPRPWSVERSPAFG